MSGCLRTFVFYSHQWNSVLRSADGSPLGPPVSDPRHPAGKQAAVGLGFGPTLRMRSIPIEHKTYNSGVSRSGQGPTHFAYSDGNALSNWQIKDLFCHFEQAFHKNGAACEYDSSTDHLVQTGLLDVFLHKADNFLHARLDNLTKNFLAD